MQIDGHHTMTYVAARLAGYNKRDADIIAYSAQYVDDATNAGVVYFKNDAMYSRIASAHKSLDYRNSEALANHHVWIPFHFLPGNGGMAAGENPEGSFINKLICRPNSHVAHDMLKACARHLDKPYALHRIGITMHVYADTWAHQGFAGVINKVNEVNDPDSDSASFNQGFFKRIAGFFLSEGFPLGHGAALSYPDQPYLKWRYENHEGKRVIRDNPKDYLEAVDYMCRAMQCFKVKDRGVDLSAATGLPDADAAKIQDLIGQLSDEDGDKRHQAWISKIKEGHFSFGPDLDVGYTPKGEDSWKHRAIGETKSTDSGREVYPYRKSFLKSNWKYFHDALQGHRFDVLHDVLPKYGICAA